MVTHKKIYKWRYKLTQMQEKVVYIKCNHGPTSLELATCCLVNLKGHKAQDHILTHPANLWQVDVAVVANEILRALLLGGATPNVSYSSWWEVQACEQLAQYEALL